MSAMCRGGRHLLTPENTVERHKRGRVSLCCLACERERTKRRRGTAGAERLRKERRARAQEAERKRWEVRREVERARRERLRFVGPRDGWEDEYGQCPPKAHSSVWVDRVVLERALSGQKIGRYMTAGERRALELLRALRGGNRQGRAA